jgi:5'-nucleotidase
LGYKYTSNKIDDQKLAREVTGIDLILGGHTHTFMEEPEKISHNNGQETLINQVGWAGINLGRIDYVFNRRLNVKTRIAASVVPILNKVKTS